MFKLIQRWLHTRREARLYAEMSRGINRDRARMRVLMPYKARKDRGRTL
jgi:hypothetical protein